MAPVEEDKGEIKDRHSSDKKSEKSDYDTTDVVEETVADTEEDGQNRRRRRRGGRRRRRSEDTEDSASEDESSDSDDSQTSSDNDSESSSSDATHRRRRRRRRRGEDISGSDDDPSDVVIKVREPRSRQSVADEVTGIEVRLVSRLRSSVVGRDVPPDVAAVPSSPTRSSWPVASRSTAR